MNQLIDDFLNKKVIAFKLNIIEIIIWLTAIIFALLIKLMHWPGGNIVLCISSAGFCSYSFFGLIFSKAKDKLSVSLSFVSILWVLFIFYGNYFRNGYPLNLYGISIFGITLFIIFTIHFAIYRIKYHK